MYYKVINIAFALETNLFNININIEIRKISHSVISNELDRELLNQSRYPNDRFKIKSRYTSNSIFSSFA